MPIIAFKSCARCRHGDIGQGLDGEIFCIQCGYRPNVTQEPLELRRSDSHHTPWSKQRAERSIIDLSIYFEHRLRLVRLDYLIDRSKYNKPVALPLEVSGVAWEIPWPSVRVCERLREAFKESVGINLMFMDEYAKSTALSVPAGFVNGTG